MIRALFGPTSLTAKLRSGLDEAMAVHRAVANRVALARTSSSADGFGNALEGKQAAAGQAARSDEDLEGDMALLADNGLRYEFESRFLKGAYDSIRKAIENHG
jgi:flagellar basal body rod protein FlgB